MTTSTEERDARRKLHFAQVRSNKGCRQHIYSPYRVLLWLLFTRSTAVRTLRVNKFSATLQVDIRKAEVELLTSRKAILDRLGFLHHLGWIHPIKVVDKYIWDISVKIPERFPGDENEAKFKMGSGQRLLREALQDVDSEE